MTDDDRYCWRDHVISPRHAAVDLVVAVLSAAVIAGAAFADSGRTSNALPMAAPAAIAEQVPPLPQITKRPILSRRVEDRL